MTLELKRGKVTEDANEVLKAAELIKLGARMHLLESELTLSRDRIIRLYRELRGISPPKGTSSSSSDWYLTSMPNIHASLFYNVFLFLKQRCRCERLDAVTKGYQVYLDHCRGNQLEAVLSFTRAWAMVQLFEKDALHLTACNRCTGKFVTKEAGMDHHGLCSICRQTAS